MLQVMCGLSSFMENLWDDSFQCLTDSTGHNSGEEEHGLTHSSGEEQHGRAHSSEEEQHATAHNSGEEQDQGQNKDHKLIHAMVPASQCPEALTPPSAKDRG